MNAPAPSRSNGKASDLQGKSSDFRADPVRKTSDFARKASESARKSAKASLDPEKVRKNGKRTRPVDLEAEEMEEVEPKRMAVPEPEIMPETVPEPVLEVPVPLRMPIPVPSPFKVPLSSHVPDPIAKARLNSLGPMLVEELQTYGIPPADIKKLKENGKWTVEGIAYAPKRLLVKIKGLSEAKVDKIMEAARKLVPTGFTSAAQIIAQRDVVIKIKCGSRDVDDILEGGFETGSITELYGEYRTGKTQLIHSLLLNCQLPVALGGAEGKALYIDGEGTFRPERLRPMAARYQMNMKEVLENIAYARCYNSDHQRTLLVEATSIMSETRFSLIVVDSATALFRSEYIGRAELAARQQALGAFLRELQRMADEFGVAVVVTNQVVAQVDGMAQFGGPQVKAIGGNIMAHAATTRIALRKGKGGERIAKVVASPCLPEAEAKFMIVEEGIIDVKES